MTNSDAFTFAALFAAAGPQTGSFSQGLFCSLSSESFMLPPSLSFVVAELQAGSVIHSPLRS
jgi:hypothetical protein